MTNEPIQTQKQYTPQHTFEEDTISFMDILLDLAKHLKLIIITPTVFCIITIIYALLFASPIYVSTIKFMSSSSDSGTQSQVMGLASQFGISIPKSSIPAWSYIDVANSRTLARSILNRKFDTEKYGPQKELLQILTYGDEEPTVGIDALIKSGIDGIQGMIEINSSGSMYELEISTFEPQLAADVAKAVTEELDKYQQEYNARHTIKTREFIEGLLIDTKAELEEAEEDLKNFRETNRNIISSPALQLKEGRLERNVAVLIGVYTTLRQQLETAKIEEVKKMDYVLILDKAEAPRYPSKPKKKLVVILAGILGIGLGVVLAFIREYAQNGDEKEREKMGKAKSLIMENIADFLPERIRYRLTFIK